MKETKGKKRLWPNSEVLFQYVFEGNGRNYENSQSVQSASRPRFEPSISHNKVRSITAWTICSVILLIKAIKGSLFHVLSRSGKKTQSKSSYIKRIFILEYEISYGVFSREPLQYPEEASMLCSRLYRKQHWNVGNASYITLFKSLSTEFFHFISDLFNEPLFIYFVIPLCRISVSARL